MPVRKARAAVSSQRFLLHSRILKPLRNFGEEKQIELCRTQDFPILFDHDLSLRNSGLECFLYFLVLTIICEVAKGWTVHFTDEEMEPQAGETYTRSYSY